MHIVLPNSGAQNIQEEGIRGSVVLLGFITDTWERYLASGRSTTLNHTMPASITHIIVEGIVYRVGRRRKVWFYKDHNGYNQQLFYITEMIGPDDHPYQLLVSHDESGRYDCLRLVRRRKLGGGTGGFSPYSHSPRIEYSS